MRLCQFFMIAAASLLRSFLSPHENASRGNNDDRDGDQREKGFIGPAPDNIAHFCQVLHGDVSDNCRGLDQRRDLAGKDRSDMGHGLGQNNTEKYLEIKLQILKGGENAPVENTQKAAEQKEVPDPVASYE